MLIKSQSYLEKESSLHYFQCDEIQDKKELLVKTLYGIFWSATPDGGK